MLESDQNVHERERVSRKQISAFEAARDVGSGILSFEQDHLAEAAIVGATTWIFRKRLLTLLSRALLVQSALDLPAAVRNAFNGALQSTREDTERARFVRFSAGYQLARAVHDALPLLRKLPARPGAIGVDSQVAPKYTPDSLLHSNYNFEHSRVAGLTLSALHTARSNLLKLSKTAPLSLGSDSFTFPTSNPEITLSNPPQTLSGLRLWKRWLDADSSKPDELKKLITVCAFRDLPREAQRIYRSGKGGVLVAPGPELGVWYRPSPSDDSWFDSVHLPTDVASFLRKFFQGNKLLAFSSPELTLARMAEVTETLSQVVPPGSSFNILLESISQKETIQYVDDTSYPHQDRVTQGIALWAPFGPRTVILHPDFNNPNVSAFRGIQEKRSLRVSEMKDLHPYSVEPPSGSILVIIPDSDRDTPWHATPLLHGYQAADDDRNKRQNQLRLLISLHNVW